MRTAVAMVMSRCSELCRVVRLQLKAMTKEWARDLYRIAAIVALTSTDWNWPEMPVACRILFVPMALRLPNNRSFPTCYAFTLVACSRVSRRLMPIADPAVI